MDSVGDSGALPHRGVRFTVRVGVCSSHVDVRVGGILLVLEPALPALELTRRGREALVVSAEYPDVARVKVGWFRHVVVTRLATVFPGLLDVRTAPLDGESVVIGVFLLVALSAHWFASLRVRRPRLLEEPLHLRLAAVLVPDRSQRSLGARSGKPSLNQPLHELLLGLERACDRRRDA